MRYCVLLLLLLAGNRVFGTTYYMAANGSDGNSGTHPDSAWLTLEKLSLQALIAGDSVLFQSGDVFRGTYYLQADGSLLQLIYIGTYNGSVPAVISGSVPLSGWVLQAGGVYAASIDSTVKGLFVNGKMETSARYPSSGYLWVNQALGTGGFKSDALTQPDGYWNGATVRIRTTPDYFETRYVQSFAAGTITFNQASASNTNAGNGFYLDGFAAALDTPHEWYYDAALQTVLYKSAAGIDPNAQTEEASIFDYGIFCATPLVNVSIHNLSFRHQAVEGIHSDYALTKVEIDSCRFNRILQTAVSLTGVADHLSFDDNSCTDILSKGVRFDFVQNASFDRNAFHRIGLIAGAGVGGKEQGAALLLMNGSDNSLRYNTIDSIGGIGVYLIGSNDTLERSIISNAVMVSNNQSAVYSSGSNNIAMVNNIIRDVVGDCAACANKTTIASGYYFENGCYQNLILGNTIANVSQFGIRMSNENTDFAIANNVVYNSGAAQIAFQNFSSGTALQAGNTLKRNVFYSLSQSQMACLFQSDQDSIAHAEADSNYYVNPYNYYFVHQDLLTNVNPTTDYSLPQWQVLTSLDSHSTTTKFFFTQYKTIDTVGSDLIQNGTFTNNFDSWEAVPDTVAELLLDNSTQMDGGCAKLRYVDTNHRRADLLSSAAPSQASTLYELSYDMYGENDGTCYVTIFENGGGFLSQYQTAVHTHSTRKGFRDYWPAQQSDYPVRLRFTTFPQDSVSWFDNIHLFPVTGLHLDSTFYSRLLTNTTLSPITYNFGDSTFFNLDSVQISSVTVQPYESVVVIYVPEDFNVAVKPEPQYESAMQVWPNPSSSELHVRYPCATKALPYEIIDAKGATLVKGTLENCGGSVPVSALPSGLYMLKVIGNDGVYRSPIVVTH